jgi:HAD superfamily phosphatase
VDQIIVFDMDGVLTDVSDSYRETIVQTVEHFTGKRITRDLIQQYKNQGGWNNDWALSKKIASDLGFEIGYDEIVDKFNQLFLGEHHDGLIQRERWYPRDGLLARLAQRAQLGIFTGRLRWELEITLKRFASDVTFEPTICADDVVRAKPDPEGLHTIQRRMAGRQIIYVGDTVDDARAASSAGVPFIGIAAADHSRRTDLVRLFEGERAMAIIENVNEIEGVL